MMAAPERMQRDEVHDEDLHALVSGDEHGKPPRIGDHPWAVPNKTLRLDAGGEHLVWHWDPVPEPEDWFRPGPTMLAQFVGLRDAEPERILAYARRWGVLGICPHGLPSSHNPTQDLGAGEVIEGCEGIGRLNDEGQWVFREPIAAWHRFATEAYAIAATAARLRGYGSGPDLSPHGRLTLTLRLWKALNRWLALGGVGPAIILHPDWPKVEPERALVPTIGAPGLFGALALRLSLASTGAAGLAPCAGCGEWFSPSVTPRTGERQWCSKPACQKAKRASASRGYRERQRAKSAANGTLEV